MYGERLKIYPQVKFLGITFYFKLTLQRHFEEILEHCNTRYHRVRLIVNKKWGHSSPTKLQIHKHCVRPVFEYGAHSTKTTSDTILSKVQRPQNKFFKLALRLPKYVSVKLLHDSSGLPYVKERFLFCATGALERISNNSLVEESAAFERVNLPWDPFPTPFSVFRLVSLQTNITYRGNVSKHLVAPEAEVLAYTGTRLSQSSDLEIKVNTGYSASLPPSISYIWPFSLTASPVTRNEFLHTENKLEYRNNIYSIFSNVVCICNFHLSNPHEIVPRINDKLCKS